jgi:pSer/pThr/pTyr-binding forkhead associated (FHA) protein
VGDTLFVGAPSTALDRRHFEIRRTAGEAGEEVFLIRDLGSRSGTYVNHQPLFDSLALKNGDEIRTAVRFVFYLE